MNKFRSQKVMAKYSTPSTKSWAVGLILLFVSLWHIFLAGYDALLWIRNYSDIQFLGELSRMFPNLFSVVASELYSSIHESVPNLVFLERAVGIIVAVIAVLFFIAFWMQTRGNYRGLLFEKALRIILLIVYVLYTFALLFFPSTWLEGIPRGLDEEMYKILMIHLIPTGLFCFMLVAGVISMNDYMRNYGTEEYYPLNFTK